MRLAWLAVALVSFAAPAAAQHSPRPADARAVAACFERFAQHGESEVRTVQPAGALAALAGPHTELRCMPASYRSLPVPTRDGAPRAAACFTRLAAVTDAAMAAQLEAACVALAQSVEAYPTSMLSARVGRGGGGAAPGIDVAVPMVMREHVTAGQEAVASAVRALRDALVECHADGNGTVVLYVSAELTTSDALVVELRDGANMPLGLCAALAARGARLTPGPYVHPGEPWSSLVELRFTEPQQVLLGTVGSNDGALADVLRGGAVTGNASDVLAQASGVSVAAPVVTRVRQGTGATVTVADARRALDEREGRLRACFASQSVRTVVAHVTVSSEGIARSVTVEPASPVGRCVLERVLGSMPWPHAASEFDLTLHVP